MSNNNKVLLIFYTVEMETYASVLGLTQFNRLARPLLMLERLAGS